jgi:Xaa-Pro aminopeptidase
MDIRHALHQSGLDGYLLPVTDEYQGEYSAAYARRVTWLCGFDGSAGILLILPHQATLLVDGRYTLQAQQEVDTALYSVYNSSEVTVASLLQELPPGRRIGYDPWLMTGHQIDRLVDALDGHAMLLSSPNPVDAIWKDQPARPQGNIYWHPLTYAGRSHEDKLDAMAEVLRNKKVKGFPLTTPDALCWLLNIRGDDIPFNPLPLAYGIAWDDATCNVYIDPSRVPDEVNACLKGRVQWRKPEQWQNDLAALVPGERIGYDPEQSPVGIRQALIGQGVVVVPMANPCLLPKAIKVPEELEGMRRAHLHDGVAVVRFLAWFDGLDSNDVINELQVVEKVEQCRRLSPDYVGPSFATIAGSGPHGAIVHYRATEQSNRTIIQDDVLLLDSGGQYRFGTTDITRTIVRGQPSADFQKHFTMVLKGHIALAQARFPAGTTGGQLDVLARLPLWQQGKDYDHGTGHGVGAHLCVHEGPQRISKRGGDVALQPGMILSNEPGYYCTGLYGIRIENLVAVVEKERHEDRVFLGFETLTLCPIDRRLIDRAGLTDMERTWLNEYHRDVRAALEPFLEGAEAAWLFERTQPV